MSHVVDLLLVEDDSGDVLLVQEALASFEHQVRLHVVSDGDQALALLADPAFPRPHFMLMDLNTPRMGALEVLTVMRAHGAWSLIPVIVYSSSAVPAEVLRAHQAGASAYLVKPAELDAFFTLIQSTVAFWQATVAPGKAEQ